MSYDKFELITRTSILRYSLHEDKRFVNKSDTYEVKRGTISINNGNKSSGKWHSCFKKGTIN